MSSLTAGALPRDRGADFVLSILILPPVDAVGAGAAVCAARTLARTSAMSGQRTSASRSAADFAADKSKVSALEEFLRKGEGGG
jgi:hypothetical protein